MNRLLPIVRRGAPFLLTLLLCLPVLASVAAAQSDQLPARRVGYRFSDGVPLLTFSVRDLLTDRARRKLQSGLPQTIVMRVYAYSEGHSRPLAIGPRACRVVYDLWEEVYRLQVQAAFDDRSETVRSLDSVLERCLDARAFRVGRRSDYSATTGRLYFAVLVEFNPLSSDTVQRIRRWLARPAGGSLGDDAFFGSFVSLFVNRQIGDAERTVRFRSQTFSVP